MKKVFLISYSGGNSHLIEQGVKSYSDWFQFNKDTYLIFELVTALDVRKQLEVNMLQGKDKLLVLEVNIKDVNGWLLQNEWDWINSKKFL